MHYPLGYTCRTLTTIVCAGLLILECTGKVPIHISREVYFIIQCVFQSYLFCRYTSLDGMHDTHPNPSLLVTTDNRTNGITQTVLGSAEGRSYLPAYMLYDEGLERAGRTSKKSAL